jgi:hypothetical protein
LPEGRDRGGYYPEFDGTIDAPPPSTLIPSDRGIAEGGLNAVLVQLANTLLLGGWGGREADDFDMDAPLAGWDPRLDAEIIDGITYPELHYLPQEQITGYGRNLRDAILSDDILSEEELASMAWESAVDEVLSMRELTAPGAPRPAPRREDPEVFAAWVRTYNQLSTQVWAVRRYVVREDFFARLETALDALRTRPQEGVDLLRAYQVTIERWLREQWGPMAHVRHTRPGKVLTFDRHARLATVLLAEDAIFRTEEDALLAAVQERIRQDTLALADAEAAWAAAQQSADEHAAALNAALAALTAHDLTSAALFAAQVTDAASSEAASALLGTAADDLVNNVVLNETTEQTLLNDAHAIREGTAQQLADVAQADIDRALTERDTIQIQSDQAAVTALNAVRSLHQIDADAAQAALKDAQGRTPPPTLPELDALGKTAEAAVKVVVQDTAAIATARQELAAHTQLAADHVRATTEHIKEAADHARALQAAVLKMQRDLAELARTGELTNDEAQGVNQRLLAVSDALSRFIAHTNQLIDLSALLEDDAQALYDATAAALDDRRQARLILAALGLARQRLQTDLEQLRHLVVSLSALRGMRLVRTGKGLPRLQETYNVHFPFALNEPPASLLRGPDAWDLPWLIAPTDRWLYWKTTGATTLYRVAWPPSEGWAAERVHDDLPPAQWLFGASTPPEQNTEIVLMTLGPDLVAQEREVATPAVDVAFSNTLNGLLQLTFRQPAQRFRHLAAMGFGTTARTWAPAPAQVIVGAIANDGVATGGGAELIGQSEGPSWEIYTRIVVIADVLTCTGVDFFGNEYTYTITNFKPISPLVGIVHPVWDYLKAQRMYQGALGTLTVANTLANAITWYVMGAFGIEELMLYTICPGDNASTSVRAYGMTESGQGWPGYVNGWVPPGPGPQCLGAWEYDGIPASVYVWTHAGTYEDIAQTSREPADASFTYNYIPYPLREPTLYVQGVGCTPSTPVPVTPTVALVTAALTAERKILLYGQVFALDEELGTYTRPAQVLRWTADRRFWTPLETVVWLQAVSADGVDLLGYDADEHQVYSVDSGTTWAPCPALADGTRVVPAVPVTPFSYYLHDTEDYQSQHPNILHFVDEVG